MVEMVQHIQLADHQNIMQVAVVAVAVVMDRTVKAEPTIIPMDGVVEVAVAMVVVMETTHLQAI
jgi:hypothetical protein